VAWRLFRRFKRILQNKNPNRLERKSVLLGWEQNETAQGEQNETQPAAVFWSGGQGQKAAVFQRKNVWSRRLLARAGERRQRASETPLALPPVATA
jgi:hypothetical protein